MITVIPVGWLSPADKCWDTNMIPRRLLDGALYPHGINFRYYAGYPNTNDGCCLIIPGRYWADHYEEIRSAIRRYPWVLAFRTSDEEDTFDVTRVEHPNIRWWVQTPRPGREYGDARLFGVGFPPIFNRLPAERTGRFVDVFLSAQNTHERRHQAFAALKDFDVQRTQGFTQGMPQDEYAVAMISAKVAPAPSGAVSPDSFRAFEALESHCVPLLDDVSPVDGPTGYWRRLFADSWPIPAPVIADWREAPAIITQTLADYPAIANRVAAWWMRTKREYSIALRADLEQLGAL